MGGTFFCTACDETHGIDDHEIITPGVAERRIEQALDDGWLAGALDVLDIVASKDDCRTCGELIYFARHFSSPNAWRVFGEDGKRHSCEGDKRAPHDGSPRGRR